MQLRHISSLTDPSSDYKRFNAISWSYNDTRLACASSERVVYLYDEVPTLRSKFQAYGTDPKAFQITSLAFSPDGTKLALGQTDNMICVYELGTQWTDKKKICGRFKTTSPVLSLVWPSDKPNDIIIGLAEGKLLICNLRSRQTSLLYHAESPVNVLSASPDGTCVVAGCADGNVRHFTFDEQNSAIATHSIVYRLNCVPSVIGYGSSIMVAGADNRVIFLTPQGNVLRTFDYGTDNENEKMDFTCGCFNTSGTTALLGTWNFVYIFDYDSHGGWYCSNIKEVANLTPSTMCWRSDGSKVLVGTVNGGLELFDSCLRRVRVGLKFELVYVSSLQVNVKWLTTDDKVQLMSSSGAEIQDVKITRDRYLIANTPNTLILADLDARQMSEIAWNGSGQEKYMFVDDAVLIYNTGELVLVVFGDSEPLAIVRTEKVSHHLLSLRLTQYGDVPIKRLAFLVDPRTIRILDCNTGQAVTTVSHDSKIDFIELNITGDRLLFRDKKQRLFIIYMEKTTESISDKFYGGLQVLSSVLETEDDSSRQKRTILEHCSYAQWIPDSNVIVAQSRNQLSVFYNIDAPDQVTTFEVDGDVVDIERSDGRTEVVVEETTGSIMYMLDESLIEYGAAMQTGDYSRAVSLLGDLVVTPEIEAMWKNLAESALEDNKLLIAERSYIALGDIAKATFVRRINDKINQLAQQLQDINLAQEHYSVQALLFCLDNKIDEAVKLYVERGLIGEGIELLNTIGHRDDAVRLALENDFHNAQQLQSAHYQALIEEQRFAEAADMKVVQEDYLSAINLYLQAGLPARAAQLLVKHNLQVELDFGIVIANSLVTSGLTSLAGGLFEKFGKNEMALQSYVKGENYEEAINLCIKMSSVDQKYRTAQLKLESQWGELLLTQGRAHLAIQHFMNARDHISAVKAAITAKRYSEAEKYLESIAPDKSISYFMQLAKLYETKSDLSTAERLLIKCNEFSSIVEMYIRHERWELVKSVAQRHLTEEEATTLFISTAGQLAEKRQFIDAERLYLYAQQPDLAISMYRTVEDFDSMVRLVEEHRPDLLQKTHLHLAEHLEKESRYKEAEKHYIGAGAEFWKKAIQMYAKNTMWHDALSLAKKFGGEDLRDYVALMWARSLGEGQGARLLVRLGLIDQAIGFAIDSMDFDLAFQIARDSLPTSLPDVQEKFGKHLESQGKVKEAEEQYIKANKPMEAVRMFIDKNDFDDAQRVAETSNKDDCMKYYWKNLAEKHCANQEFEQAEALFIQAGDFERIVEVYKNANRVHDALRIAEQYAPSMVTELRRFYAAPLANSSNLKDVILAARLFESNQEYGRAIDTYLNLTAENCPDIPSLAKYYQTAVSLALSHLPNRAQSILDQAAQSLLKIGQPKLAADLHLKLSDADSAVRLLISAEEYALAKKIAQLHANHMLKTVNDAQVQSLVKQNRAEDLVTMGNVNEGIDLYASRNQWDKALTIAKQEGAQAMSKYASLRCKELADTLSLQGENEVAEAILLLNDVKIDPNDKNRKEYLKLCQFALQSNPARLVPALQKSQITISTFYKKLRNILNNLNSISNNKDSSTLFEAAHLMSQAYRSEDEGLINITAKCWVSLLRYVQFIPQDKLLVEAGLANKKAGNLSVAFVFLNRYLDILDAMDPSNDGFETLDNTDFIETDIVFPQNLPQQHYCNAKQKTDIKNWVLATSMENVEQSLPMERCVSCHAQMFNGSLVCHNCHHKYYSCMVTGYPVLNVVKCTSCNSPANREEFNQWVGKTRVCPNCESSQTANYS
eukprot:TRINITY_DN3240_c0_g1_i1.p1 TRINITY_DN3240_c0_g1~~TRINITY_DN3240_c0_g1_i1.p1  ORF type:complete len:1781 (+),score=508.40 TRINITY_DN3240_c0_g1_i1:25-5343(+)